MVELCFGKPLDSTFKEVTIDLPCFHRRTNPIIPTPARTTEVHGMSNEDVRDKQTFEAVASELSDWLEEAFVQSGTVGALVAHNGNAFDVPFSHNQFQQHSVE